MTLRFSSRRFPLALGACYRAPWRLPGPDSHRLANTSLHEIASSLTTTSSHGAPFSGHAGFQLAPRDQADRDQRVASTQNALGDVAFAAAWAEGRAMALEQVIEYALAASDE